MVRYTLTDSGFPSSTRGELLKVAANFKNRTSHKALTMETPFKMLYGEEADLSHLHVIGARTFVHIKGPRKLDTAAWEAKVCSYSEESKSYRLWNPKTRRVVENRDVTFIETPSHLFFWPSKLSLWQDLVPPPWDPDEDTMGNDYISYDDLLPDVRDYTGVLDYTTNIPANHENVSDVSVDPQSVISPRETCSRPLHLRMEPHSPQNLCLEQQENLLCQREYHRREEGERFRRPPCWLQQEGGRYQTNRIHRSNAVTQRAAAELTGAVTRYRGVRPNNNNNHAALMEPFEPSTLHKLRQLGLCTSTDTPNTAHQLDAEAVAAEVAYTMSTHSRAVREGENRTVSRTPSRRPWTYTRRRVGMKNRTRRSQV